MSELVKIQFKSGAIKEVSADIANNAQYQKSHGFVVLSNESEVIEKPKAKIITPEPAEEKKTIEKENVVVAVEAQVETESIVSEPKKRGRKPKSK